MAFNLMVGYFILTGTSGSEKESSFREPCGGYLSSFSFSDICVMLFKTWSILIMRSFSWLSKDITSRTFSLFSLSQTSSVMIIIGEPSRSYLMLDEFLSSWDALRRVSDYASLREASSNMMWKALMGRPAEEREDYGDLAPYLPMFFHNGPLPNINNQINTLFYHESRLFTCYLIDGFGSQLFLGCLVRENNITIGLIGEKWRSYNIIAAICSYFLYTRHNNFKIR
jgi:hypothetical protein